MHPRSKHWHLIDHVIVRRKDRQDVRVTKTMCGADCWTDHRLVVSKLNLRIQPARRPHGKKLLKRLGVSKLKQDNKRQAFSNDICSRLDAMVLTADDPEENWTVHSSAMDSIGLVSRKHQDWFEEKSRDSLKRNTKNTRHTLMIPAQYPLRRHIQIYVRQSRLGLEICKTPGWAVRLIKSSPLQIERIWRSSLMR